ncbi:hypothetical protein ACTFIY_008875 [Dictyostelium cf. discoideum]
MTHNNSESFETPNRNGNVVNRSSLTSPTSPIILISPLNLNQTNTSLNLNSQRTVRGQQRPQRPNATQPPTTNIVENFFWCTKLCIELVFLNTMQLERFPLVLLELLNSLAIYSLMFHVVKKMNRWKSNDKVDTFYDKKIIGEKSGGFLNTVVQIS